MLTVVTAWVMAIKWAAGRSPNPQDAADYVTSRLDSLAATRINIELPHPLDGPILTADRTFQAYDVELLLVN